MKTYVLIIGDTQTSVDTTNNITLYNNNTLIFNFKNFIDTYDKIIKIDFYWDVKTDAQLDSKADDSICYTSMNNFRGNMLSKLRTDDNKSIVSIKEHYYEIPYNYDYKSNINTKILIYTASGKCIIKTIIFKFKNPDFVDTIGGINVLNAQYIDNEYNYLFITAETTKNKYIVNYCLKQLANRKNISSSKIIIDDPDIPVGEGEIVSIDNNMIYFCTINGDPLYLIS